MFIVLWMFEIGKYFVIFLDKFEVLFVFDVVSMGELCLVYEFYRKQEKINGLFLDINKVFFDFMD